MKTTLTILMLLSLALTACVVAGGPGYGDRGGHGYDRGGGAESHGGWDH